MNGKRVLIGGLAGGIAWIVWSCIVSMVFLSPTYMAEGQAGHLLAQPRYGASMFFTGWAVALLLVSCIAAWLYAAVRASLGAGPKTAFKVGAVLGFAAGIPVNLYVISWSPLTTSVPIWWVADMWVGAIIATLVAGSLYKDK
jgi:hypothetical protein